MPVWCNEQPMVDKHFEKISFKAYGWNERVQGGVDFQNLFPTSKEA